MYKSSMRVAVALLLPLFALAACGDQKPAESNKASEAGSDATTSVAVSATPSKNPCAFLTSAEVEAVLGPLAGPPFRANNGVADPNGGICRYETPAFRAIELHVDWSDGGRTFGIMNMVQGVVAKGGLKGVFKTQEGTTLTGEWDEARLNSCCEFAALRGEQLVTVDIGASRATVEQAAKLADLAVQRLDGPLGADVIEKRNSVRQVVVVRPKPRSVCELLSRADVEAISHASLRGDPVGSNTSCTYAWVPEPNGIERQMTLKVEWRDGFKEMREAQAAMGQAFSFLKSEGLDVDQEQAKPGSLDEDATNIVGVMAVKKDVMLSVERGDIMNDLAHALIVKAASKL